MNGAPLWDLVPAQWRYIWAHVSSTDGNNFFISHLLLKAHFDNPDVRGFIGFVAKIRKKPILYSIVTVENITQKNFYTIHQAGFSLPKSHNYFQNLKLVPIKPKIHIIEKGTAQNSSLDIVFCSRTKVTGFITVSGKTIPVEGTGFVEDALQTSVPRNIAF